MGRSASRTLRYEARYGWPWHWTAGVSAVRMPRMNDERTPDEDNERTPDEQGEQGEQGGGEGGSTASTNADVTLGRAPNGDDTADDDKTPTSDDG